MLDRQQSLVKHLVVVGHHEFSIVRSITPRLFDKSSFHSSRKPHLFNVSRISADAENLKGFHLQMQNPTLTATTNDIFKIRFVA